ncbi:MAG: T9SS type A sorting domain-containing protein [Salibacteraceae bacterium]
MKNLLFLVVALVYSATSIAQKATDKTFNFQTDPNKKVSFYEPSTYKKGTDNALMLALHPWNTNRWNSSSWRDTLISFAEENGLILLCPDGGSDGQIDDQIDLDFTNAMLDSVQKWYSIDAKRIYCMGFSWGGKATYTYGLSKPEIFCGYIPIGAAIDVREVALVSANANQKPIYIVHGQSDAFSSRFVPLRKAMEDNGGIVNSHIHIDGHTIDFPNRNTELTKAYTWVDSVCISEPTSFVPLIKTEVINVYPNPVLVNDEIQLNGNSVDFSEYSIIDINGKLISKGNLNKTIKAPSKKGNYVLILSGSGRELKKKIVVN